jgi:hypothetical protein
MTPDPRSEDALQARRAPRAEALKLRPAVVDGRAVDRAQHPVGHVGRARDLQEMASRSVHGWVLPGGGLWHSRSRMRSPAEPRAARKADLPASRRQSGAGPSSAEAPHVARRLLRRCGLAREASTAESPVRRGLARALLDRRLDLPDRAGRRGRAAHRGGCAPRSRSRRGGRAGAAARRGHLAVRPDRRRGARHRRSKYI